jgi:peptide/nickel transport system permease protein
MSVVDERLTSATTNDQIAAQRSERSRWHTFIGFLRRNPRIPFYSGIMIVVFAITLAAPLIAPYGEREVNTSERMQSPSMKHWLGTDQLGRDTFSRLLYGGRVSLPLGLMAVVLSAASGIMMGVVAGHFGGVIDQLTGRLVDAQLAFPELILALAIVAVFGQSIFNVMIVVGLAGYPAYYRLARGQVLQAREFEYVKAARSVGAGDRRIMFRHILPNILNPLIIQTSLAAGTAVLLQSSLGFFGLGPKAGTADWGSMFFDGLNNFRIQPWLVFGPGIAVFISVLSFFMLGDALRDALDPHLRGRRV